MDNNLKSFLIKLISIVVAIIIIINVTYNLLLADKVEALHSLLLLSKKENRLQLKEKIKTELERGLAKDQILNKEDKELLYKFYLKLKKEFQDIDN